MSYPTDLIVYLWLIPIFTFIFLPLALTTVALVKNLSQRFLVAKEMTSEEQRKHPRFSSSDDTFAKITVDDKTCTGLVCNISKTGVSLKHLPEMISQEIDKLSVVIHHCGIDYTMLFKTKWTELTESGRRLGAEIDSTSTDWGQLLLRTKKMGQLKPV